MSCGIGACERQSSCEGGAVRCEPGPPLSADDQTCDGIDDNCDGIPDEDCAVNRIFFSLVDRGPDRVSIQVVLSRGDELVLNPLTLPRGMELRFNPDARLTPGGSPIAGAAIEEANARLTPLTLGATQRVIILPASGQGIEERRIGAGVLFEQEYLIPPGSAGPFEFQWLRREPFVDQNGNEFYDNGEPFTDENGNNRRDLNSSLSPTVADRILELIDGTIE